MNNHPDQASLQMESLAKLLEKMEQTTLAIEWYEKGMAEAKKAGDNHAYSELQSAYEDLVY